MGFTPEHSRGQSRGLADLLGHDFLGSTSLGSLASNMSYESYLKLSVCHVLDLCSPDILGQDVQEGIASALEQRLSQETQDSSSDVGTSSAVEGSNDSLIAGKIGPARVIIDRASSQGQLQFTQNDLAAESLNNFSSFRANACCFSGKWMYEVTIQTAWQPGIQQIGWATIQCPFTAEEGVGDAPDSYAYDGKRVRKWNVKSQVYGEAWSSGDVIGSLIDLDRGEITFYRNGVSLGVAFRNVRTMQPSMAYFPTVSLSYAERCELNFGARPFIYPVSGYHPLQQAPSAEQQAQVNYLLGCLERLARLASAGSTRGLPSFDSYWGVAEGDEEGEGDKVSENAMAGRLLNDAWEETQGSSASSQRHLSWDDTAVLAGSICQHLLPLLLPPAVHGNDSFCHTEYMVVGPLLQSLLKLHGSAEPHDPASARAAVRLLQVCMDPDAFSHVMAILLEALSRRCVSAPMVSNDFPYSAAYPFLSLAACLASGVTAVREALLNHKSLYHVMESFMARKPPSSEDLKELLPVVWWPGCKDETASEAKMRDGIRAVAATKAKLEDGQYRLLMLLAGQPSDGDAGEDALIAFVRYLVQRNRGASRDVQPHGLSDANVLLSVWFSLLRLLHGVTDQVTNFPACEFFVKASQYGSMDPTNDLPRLGGLLSYLLRESPVPADDMARAVHAGPINSPPPSSPAPWLEVAGSTQTTRRDIGVERLIKRPAAAVELLHLSTMLYSYRGAGIVRQIYSLSQSLATNLAGLERVEQQLENPASTPSSSASTPEGGGMASLLGGEGGGGRSAAYLQEARNLLRLEVQTAVRCIRLLESTFFGGWKMGALLKQGAWISRALLSISQQAGPLLAYVPTCYPELVLDVLAAYRATETPFALPQELKFHGLVDIMQFVVTLTDDSRIRNPDTKEKLLAGATGMLESRGISAIVEEHPAVARRLVSAAVSMFDSSLWNPVSSVLAQVIRGFGFGALKPTAASRTTEESSDELLPPLPNCQVLLKQALHPSAPEFKGFCDRLFNTVNWAVTEGTSAAATVHEARRPAASPGSASLSTSVTPNRRTQVDEQQQVRKVVTTLELATTLLQLLEFLATNVPEAFLSPTCTLNLTRLMEVVPFVLGHFGAGPDARRLNELLETSQQQSGTPQAMMRLGTDRQYTIIHVIPDKPLYEKISKPQLLGPVVGTLLALWRADRGRGSSGPPSPAIVLALQQPTKRSKVGLSTSEEVVAAGSSRGGDCGVASVGEEVEEGGPAVVAAESPDMTAGSSAFEGKDVMMECEEEEEEEPVSHVSFMEALADATDERVKGDLAFLRALDWASGSLPDPCLIAEVEQFSELCDEVFSLQEASRNRSAAIRSAGGVGSSSIDIAGRNTAGGCSVEGSGEEIPEEFLDPITAVMMMDPVILPDSHVTVDRSTIERQLSIQGTDPFSRKELSMDMVRPNVELRTRIKAFLTDRGVGTPKGGGTPKKPSAIKSSPASSL